MRVARSRRRWTLAILVTLVAAAACSSPDTETSVYLEIYDATLVTVPTDVNLDVFDRAGGNQIATLHRTAVAQASASSPLGSVVILAGASGSSLGVLHIVGQRMRGGAMLSTGSVDVPLVASRQVGARLDLGHGGGQGDAGMTGAGGSGAGGSGASDAGGGDTASPPVDAGTPPADGGATLAANGQSCGSAGACASGFCVDGVCCNSLCDTLCHGCNLSGSRGTCAVFSAGSQCVPPSCTTTGNDLIPARTCDGNGNCSAAGATQSCGSYRCQNNACLRSCSNSNGCISSARCFNNRCQ